MDDKNHSGFFTGDIQEVHYYDHSLSADEIKDIWNARNRNPWWKKLLDWMFSSNRDNR